MTKLSSLPDAELLNLLKSGDHAAFTVVYDRYWDKLLAIAFNHTRDKSSAKEIVQNLFVGLWNRRESLHIDNINNYLATATKFAVFKEYYRAQKRETQLVSKLSIEDEYQVEEKIAAKFLQQYINGIVDTLPEKCQLVFKLSREQHKSHAEIADELQISEKTVEMHITKALKTIRAELHTSGIIIIISEAAAHLFRR